MAKQNHVFTGKIAWAHKLFTPDEMYGYYSLSFYPKDDQDRRAIKATGIKNSPKEDDGEKSGVSGWFYTLRSKTPPVVLDAEGNPYEGSIGNGSTATVIVEVETFKSKKWGSVTKSTLKKVRIDDLVEYESPDKEEEAEKKEVKGMPF